MTQTKLTKKYMTEVEVYNDIRRLTVRRNLAVIHRNGDTMDNRRENLEVVPADSDRAIRERAATFAVTKVLLPNGETGLIEMGEMVAYHAGLLTGIPHRQAYRKAEK